MIIIKQSNSEHLSREILQSTRSSNRIGKSHVTKFANGEVAVVIEESVRGEVVVIVAQPTNYTEIFELLSTIDAAKRASAKEIIALIPCLPHSRQERRVDGIRTSISAKLFADMIQIAGVDRIITADVHTTAIEGFYNIPFDNVETYDVFVECIAESDMIDEFMIVSPDFGGMKRAKKYAKLLDTDLAFINKERLKANEVAEMTLIGNVEGRDVIIFDDMIDTGGTLLKATQLLDDNGAMNIYVFATHPIFSGDAQTKLCMTENISGIFVTNSLPITKGYNATIKRVHIERLFGRLLNKIT